MLFGPETQNLGRIITCLPRASDIPTPELNGKTNLHNYILTDHSIPKYYVCIIPVSSTDIRPAWCYGPAPSDRIRAPGEADMIRIINSVVGKPPRKIGFSTPAREL